MIRQQTNRCARSLDRPLSWIGSCRRIDASDKKNGADGAERQRDGWVGCKRMACMHACVRACVRADGKRASERWVNGLRESSDADGLNALTRSVYWPGWLLGKSSRQLRGWTGMRTDEAERERERERATAAVAAAAEEEKEEKRVRMRMRRRVSRIYVCTKTVFVSI
ncbi:hypothetical protein BKA81DRAFT_53286 [Phyllosticta paracitricarpa]